jgi:hypothetical protein
MSCAPTPAEVARAGIQTAFFIRLSPLESVPGGKSTIGAWSSSTGRYASARTARRCSRENVIWEMSVQSQGSLAPCKAIWGLPTEQEGVHDAGRDCDHESQTVGAGAELAAHGETGAGSRGTACGSGDHAGIGAGRLCVQCRPHLEQGKDVRGRAGRARWSVPLFVLGS